MEDLIEKNFDVDQGEEGEEVEEVEENEEVKGNDHSNTIAKSRMLNHHLRLTEEQELVKAAEAAELEEKERSERITCRFYEDEYPQAEQCVMVEVKNIAEMGAYVSLLEYNNIEGLILFSELSRRRIRSVNKLIRVGKMEVAMVLRVDKDKGYVDLSKRRVTPQDAAACEERYRKGKAVNSLMRYVAEATGKDFEEVNHMIAWKLDREPYKDAYKALRLALIEKEKIIDPLQLDPDVEEALMANIKRQMVVQPTKIRADIDVSCFREEGIEAVREALLAAEACGTSLVPLTIKLIAPPLYVILTSTTDKDSGISVMKTAIERATEVMKAKGGKVVVKNEPRITSSQEEEQLKKILKRVGEENRELDGDDDDDEASD